MTAVVTRDVDDVRRGLTAWFSSRHPGATELAVDVRGHAAGGYSNEVVFTTIAYRLAGRDHERDLVVRLPPLGPSLFPDHDLAMQVAVQRAVADNGVPVPSPVVVEEDPTWLGSPFLVMPRVVGHDPGQLPAADPWLSTATVDQQRSLHVAFLDTLAAIHATPWVGRPVAAALRGASATLADELGWWERYVEWTFDGAAPAALVEVFDWCGGHLPADPPAPSVLWGDVRVGNVVFADDFSVAGVLDWEMASIGPAEMDLAWCTGLDALTEHVSGRRVPGFLSREAIVARHERALGRPLVDFRWFEVFALARSAALNLRVGRLAAERKGEVASPAEDDVVLACATEAIADASRRDLGEL